MPYSIIFAMHVYVVCVLLSACPCGSLPASLPLFLSLFCVFAIVYPCPTSSSTSSSSTAATPYHCPFLPNRSCLVAALGTQSQTHARRSLGSRLMMR
uniref:Putative secreted peptide n=1 Tax=Anopheles braziliensis TaxID=58242 RepID=A0A2M3ZQ03_9DIPT